MARPLLLALLGIASLAEPRPATAQMLDALSAATRSLTGTTGGTRYTHGQRLRQTEAAWLLTPNGPRRQAAIPRLEDAVRGYFAGRRSEVTLGLDAARHALLGTEVSAEQRWADAIDVLPQATLLDPTSSPLRLAIAFAYRPEERRPPLRLTATLAPWDGKSASLYGIQFTGDAAARKLTSIPGEIKLAQWSIHGLAQNETAGIPPSAPRQSQLVLRVSNTSGRVLRQWAIGLGIVPGWTAQRAQWQREIAQLPSGSPQAAERRAALQILDNMAATSPAETDYPAEALLRQAAGESTDQRFAQVSRLMAPLSARLLLPKDAHTLIVALHGAGGSEQMFFDSYGLGALADACQRRGYALITLPVGTPYDDLWPAIDKLRPAGIRHTYLVGHSLGAMLSGRLLRQRPESVEGIAVLGAGGSATNFTSTTQVLISVGTEDFARRGGEALARALQKRGIQPEAHTPVAEHLMVVAESIADLMKWVDRSTRKE